ncbi:MAG TPA: oxygenase MpaB family protein [Solirubrobacteraceae bacterium]|nr:oxygenase MpaB family protein [Solirubrobacteraceae bacterium]
MDGHFRDDSMLRRIHRERALALSGPRALLMQAAHPLAVSGLLAHSTALDDPYDRLARTAEAMSTIGFGSREEADRVTAHVRAMHRRVCGRLTNDAGPYAAGTPYRADDPELLMWVLFTLVDSGLVVYEKYVSALTEAERAAYWDDYRVVGRLFGLRDEEMPATLDELRRYRQEMLASGRLVVTDWARTRARSIVLEPPVPLYVRPLVETANFITVALLPAEIRRQYGFFPLPPVAVRRALVAGGAEYVKRVVVPLLPDRLRLVPAARGEPAAAS